MKLTFMIYGKHKAKKYGIAIILKDMNNLIARTTNSTN